MLMLQEITQKLQQNDFLWNMYTTKEKLQRKVSAKFVKSIMSKGYFCKLVNKLHMN